MSVRLATALRVFNEEIADFEEHENAMMEFNLDSAIDQFIEADRDYLVRHYGKFVEMHKRMGARLEEIWRPR
jgi:hypothetical protein